MITMDSFIWMVWGKEAILLFLFSFKNKSNFYVISDTGIKAESEPFGLETYCLEWHTI